MDENKRKQNERKFGRWDDTPGGGRIYRYEVQGRTGWKARYVKVVDSEEATIEFYQEIFNEKGQLVEIHKKYPADYGHQKVEK